MPVVTLTTTNFRRDVLESDQPVVVDFYADWCGPCRRIAPAMEALSMKWDGRVRFGKVDVDAQPEIARAYNISSIPAILRFERGEVSNWCLGAKPVHLMEKELRLTERGVGGNKEGHKSLLSRLFSRS
ncbi:MAG TPA: thioredoxin [Actinomycetota bacterium]|jgi:thioredoxin 1|nr:thioredoxin [Actinomycetota bacterium]